jgi:hypothetical protein
VSGETAAIGLGFLLAGPAGAIIGGAALPALVAASMWRARRAEHDEDTNDGANGSGDDRNGNGSGRDRAGSGGRGNGAGRGNGNGAGGRHRSPNGPGGSGGGRPKTPRTPNDRNKNGLGGTGKDKKPKTKDPVADRLGKLGKGLADKFKNKDKTDKAPKNGKGDSTDGGKHKTPKNGDTKGLKDGLRDGVKGLGLKNRGKQPNSDRPWAGRGNKPDKPKKDRKRKDNKGKGDDTSSTTARDALEPKKTKRRNDDADIVDGEIVDGGPSPRTPGGSGQDQIIDAEIVDDGLEKRIQTIRDRAARKRRRQAIAAGKKAADDAARDGTLGDPHQVKTERIRAENYRIDLELRQQDQLLALAAGTEQRRRTPVTYPLATTQPASTRTAGVAVARQIDVRGSEAYRLLVAMAEQLANGLHHDDDADMADHVVELVGIPAMCRSLSVAVREGAGTLQKTAPLHPSVIKHLNNASVAALTAAHMADSIMGVFVDAHREDIYRVLEPRVGEPRWNIRNADGTLDGAKLRAAILAGGQQRALPAGSATGGTTSSGSGKVVPASHDSTKKLITLMKGFDRGHMVVVLSEIGGAASGVEVVADSVTKLYRRMANSWPTEQVVDDTVRATAAKVRTVAAELRKAIKAAQRAHQRELTLNAKPRKGARAERKWDVVKGRRG